jgi:hypothetical protein
MLDRHAKLKIVLVKAYYLIRKLKRYYIIIQKAYNCITTKILGLNREMAF